MRVYMPTMVEDRVTSVAKGMSLCEGNQVECEEPLLDGPVSPRVAVVDIRPDGGGIAPGARLVQPPGKMATFQLPDWKGPDSEFLYDPQFMSVNVFATVIKTLQMYEESDALGRRISWGFNGKQLLLVPRAGEWANACYERASRSIQFYYFHNYDRSPHPIYTALSRDIVAHETGHAILDGIAPDLYDALLPQSLAIHESVADLTSLLMGLRSVTLREAVLDATDGSIAGPNAFDWVALEFGHERPGGGPLRNLNNNSTLGPVTRKSPCDPYKLGLVLSGMMYSLLVCLHEDLKAGLTADKQEANPGLGQAQAEVSVSGKALYIASEILKRLLVRGLDYLPPGEAAFIDVVRAVYAADQASCPESSRERLWLARECRRRGIIRSYSDLTTGVLTTGLCMSKQIVDAMVADDAAALEFAEKHRAILCVPDGAVLDVRPRIDVCKSRPTGGAGMDHCRELIFKVAWEETEHPNPDDPLCGKRQVTKGTTLVIDRDTGNATALLTTSRAAEPDRAASEARARCQMLQYLRNTGRLVVIQDSDGTTASRAAWSRSRIVASASNGAIRVRGSGRLLHIVGGDS